MEKKYKIKPLTKEQIVISLDRLTRFKPTEEKYLRVFKEIIFSNLICPKYSKKQLSVMDYTEISKSVEKIFNFSLKELGFESSANYLINKKLFEYEKSVFNFDKNVEKLIDNKIDYKSALVLLKQDSALNLKWLKSLSKDANQRLNRANLGLKFPVEKVVIAEGITEEILLPKFALACGVDFDRMGINLISAGGKNQVVKLFYQYADILKIPIFVLLDKDGEENFSEIKPKLRKRDKVYVIKSGEFEDILEVNLIKRTLNKIFKDYSNVGIKELKEDKPMTRILEEVFKQRGLEFRKAEFASELNKITLTPKDISQEIKAIVSELKD